MKSQFLVIQAFPEGMVAVIRHTVHGLLLAELANRTPIILWSNRFLYHNDRSIPCSNGFANYFKNNGLCDLGAVLESSKTFEPVGWNISNVGNDYLVNFEQVNHLTDFKPLSPGEILASQADAVVYTHYQHLVDILPLIPRDSPYYGLENSLVARKVYQKYFSLADSVLSLVNQYQETFGAQRMLGVHCRGSDKIAEYALATPRAYKPVIAKLRPETDAVFLATDSQIFLERFKSWYRDKLFTIECERSGDHRGVHFSAADRVRAGRDFLVDAYLLSGCKYHLGNHGSHVSYMVQAMLRLQGAPYDNFYNVEAPMTSSFFKLVTHNLPLAGRRTLKRVLFGAQKRK